MFLPNMILSISSVASILLSKTLLIKSSSNRVSLSTSSLTFSLAIISSLSNSYYHVSVFQSNKKIIKNELFFLHLDNHTQYSSFEYIIFTTSCTNFFVFTYHVVFIYNFSSCSSSSYKSFLIFFHSRKSIGVCSTFLISPVGIVSSLIGVNSSA